MTFIPVLAVKMDCNELVGDERFKENCLLRRAGYPTSNNFKEEPGFVILTKLDGGEPANIDPYQWHNRTMREAHEYIRYQFDNLTTGDVVDVEYILGETTSPKVSERNC